MLYIIIGIVGLLIFYLVFKFIQSSTPGGFAKGIARAQLKSLLILREKYPNTPIDELYSQVIINRPGYDGELAAKIVSDARGTAIEMGVDFKFWLVVLQLVASEYISRTNQSPINQMDKFREAVLSVIPVDL